jgi:hypothetical protein
VNGTVATEQTTESDLMTNSESPRAIQQMEKHKIQQHVDSGLSINSERPGESVLRNGGTESFVKPETAIGDRVKSKQCRGYGYQN